MADDTTFFRFEGALVRSGKARGKGKGEFETWDGNHWVRFEKPLDWEGVFIGIEEAAILLRKVSDRKSHIFDLKQARGKLFAGLS